MIAVKIADLLEEFCRHAGHYECITASACEDKELRVLLSRTYALDVSVMNPLLMSYFEGYVGVVLSHDNFAPMLQITGNLSRRSACDVASNSLNKPFSSAIAQLNTVGTTAISAGPTSQSS